ncbi:MAG: DUF6340 family protein [Bacteroides sp.]|nr:DUF6340 family protein [Bacteroides sp.]
MTKKTCCLLVVCSLLFSACQSIEQISIDYMLPANVSFPASLKRVAVVNNMPDIPDNKTIITEDEKPKGKNEVLIQTKYFNGNAVTATESLAKALAKENYFDEVVICDSALRSNDMIPRESVLSKNEVERLTRELDVDFLIALENVQLKTTRKIDYIPEWNIFHGTVDVKAYTAVRVYLPNRNGPMVTITPVDSIFWEKEDYKLEYVRSHLISEKEMLEQASEFAGSTPVHHLLPYWETGTRYYFIGNSAPMRDAAIQVKAGDWSKAIKLWEEIYEKKKGKQQMYAAYNIALGYEMQDSINTAENWALKAQTIAAQIDKIEDTQKRGTVNIENIPNYFITTKYVNELQKRNEGLVKLNMQMGRFKNVF